MKIRTQMLLSYLSIIFIIIVILLIVFNILISNLTTKTLEETQRSVKAIASYNRILAQNVLTSYGERIVEIKARYVAEELADLLGNKRINDYEQLRKNKKIRTLASQQIEAWEGIAGYVAVYDDEGLMVFHPFKEGVDTRVFENDYPELWKLIQRSFTEEVVRGYYMFVDAANKKVRKYMVTVQVPSTNLIVTATVNIDQYFRPVHEKIDGATEENIQKAKESFEGHSREYVTKTHTYSILIGIVLLLIGGLYSIRFSRSLSRPVLHFRDKASQMMNGDFTSTVDAGGPEEIIELANSFNKLSDHLNSLLTQVRQSGVKIISTATEITATARQQEDGAKDFGSSTNEITAASKEITSTSHALVNTMQDVMNAATESETIAIKGQTNLAELETTMEELKNATDSFSSRLSEINTKANNITSIVTAITQVADQTNLLSLNASIEAEKAGEYGLGFAVVAREIRRLADESAVATLDIENMVKGMESAVSVGVMEMDKFKDVVESCVEDVVRISSQLEQVIGHVQALIPRFNAVNEGIQAQSEGARQIMDAMIYLNENAQQAIESLAEYHNVTVMLKEAAKDMQKEVDRFKVRSS